jgi:hypothetical protein
MGSRHRALLITTGGGEKLQQVEKDRHKNELNDFLTSQGVNDWDRASAIAHFDIGYDDGHSGEVPYYNSEWDRPMGHEARGA